MNAQEVRKRDYTEIVREWSHILHYRKRIFGKLREIAQKEAERSDTIRKFGIGREQDRQHVLHQMKGIADSEKRALIEIERELHKTVIACQRQRSRIHDFFNNL